jgi:hypothetical protein
MTEEMYPVATPEIAVRRKQLAPEVHEAFENFSRAVFADGARAVSGRLDDLAAPAGHVDGRSG